MSATDRQWSLPLQIAERCSVDKPGQNVLVPFLFDMVSLMIVLKLMVCVKSPSFIFYSATYATDRFADTFVFIRFTYPTGFFFKSSLWLIGDWILNGVGQIQLRWLYICRGSPKIILLFPVYITLPASWALSFLVDANNTSRTFPVAGSAARSVLLTCLVNFSMFSLAFQFQLISLLIYFFS